MKNFNFFNSIDNSDIANSNRELSDIIKYAVEANNSTKDRADISLKKYLQLTKELEYYKTQAKEYKELLNDLTSTLPFSLNCFELDKAFCRYSSPSEEFCNYYDYGKIQLVLPIKGSELQEYRPSEFRKLVCDKILDYSKT